MDEADHVAVEEVASTEDPGMTIWVEGVEMIPEAGILVHRRGVDSVEDVHREVVAVDREELGECRSGKEIGSVTDAQTRTLRGGTSVIGARSQSLEVAEEQVVEGEEWVEVDSVEMTEEAAVTAEDLMADEVEEVVADSEAEAVVPIEEVQCEVVTETTDNDHTKVKFYYSHINPCFPVRPG